MAGMPADLRQQFERLLLDHPLWERSSERVVLLRGLREYEISDDLNLEGSRAEAADRLLGLYGKHGPEAFRMVLAALRDADPARIREVEALDGALRGRETQHRHGTWTEAPYLGLSHFDRQHAPIFFGRDGEVDRLFRTLVEAERRFTVIVGASGAGKSSLVRAGLWARLAEGRVPELVGSERWLISAMIPGEMESPAASLRAALVRALHDRGEFQKKREIAGSVDQWPLAEITNRLLGPGDARWLLIVDQMEELFAPERKAESAAFLDRLIQCASSPASRFQVVATLRADFFHHCLEHPPLKRTVERGGGTFLLGPPGRLAMERMISGPIEEVNLLRRWTIDPELPPVMAADAERHPGGLALMAFALRELYDRCSSNRRLDLESYRAEAFGGLSGAIARRADATLASLGERGAGALERVFQRLVRVNPDDAPTRLRERCSVWDDDPEALKLVKTFTEARLLVADSGSTGEANIEVAHEALLREWPRIADWIKGHREALRLRERVQIEAKAWKDDDLKYRWQRPWAEHLIEEHRRILEQAGLLAGVLSDAKTDRLLTPEVEWILQEVGDDATHQTRRRDIGQRLAEIGNPRRGVGVLNGVPDILWRTIPGGEVEIEGHGRFMVAPFHLGAFPVTLGQFLVFLHGKDGYGDQPWWEGLEREAPHETWQSLLANHPVTDVSWFDATAFCRWLTALVGYEVRLPDEREWQWAAQSAQAEFFYAWGPDWRKGLANTGESDIRRTTAVGMYPRGDSQQRVSDLVGNVWEWCRNEYAKPDRTQPGGEESRVLRGGSWFDNAVKARAGYRDHARPGGRNYGVGFRVVCSSPINDH